MNLILLWPDDFSPGPNRVRLRDRRLAHVRSVHQPAVGETLRVGLVGGTMGTGTVTALTADVLEMDVALTDPPPSALPLSLILALPRPKALKRILISATSMGIKRIVLINAFRVEKSYWETPLLQPEALREPLVLGLEQARDTIMPDVQLRPRFKPFVEDELPALSQDTLRLVAHPVAAEPCPYAVNRPVTLLIGPEGGFIPYEIEKLASTGFQPVQVGARILRVETALPVLVGRLF